MSGQQMPSSAELKACTRCGSMKPLSEFGTKIRKTGRKPASMCRVCKRAYDLEAWRRKGRSKQGWAKTPFSEWSAEMRSRHLEAKARARRKAGMKPLEELRREQSARKAAREAEREAEREARKAARDASRKVPAGLSEADKWRWRYHNDPEFREKQKERARRAKARVPYWYANQQLGGNSTKQYPPALVLTKQVQLKIKRYIKEQCHEEH